MEARADRPTQSSLWRLTSRCVPRWTALRSTRRRVPARRTPQVARSSFATCFALPSPRSAWSPAPRDSSGSPSSARLVTAPPRWIWTLNSPCSAAFGRERAAAAVSHREVRRGARLGEHVARADRAEAGGGDPRRPRRPSRRRRAGPIGLGLSFSSGPLGSMFSSAPGARGGGSSWPS